MPISGSATVSLTAVRVQSITPYLAAHANDAALAVEALVAAFAPTATNCLTIQFPSGDYTFSRPAVVNSSYVSFVGTGRAAHGGFTTRFLSAQGFPPLVFGLPRSQAGSFIDNTHWVDVSTLGLSVTPGTRTGYRTKGDTTVGFVGTPFDLGPSLQFLNSGSFRPGNWAQIQQLTVDLCVYANAGSWSAEVLCGMTDASGLPLPWMLWWESLNGYSGVQLVFYFKTNDGLYRRLVIPANPATPLLRLSLEVDLAAGVAYAWVNRTKVALDTSLANTGFSGGGLHFAQNWTQPFRLQGAGDRIGGSSAYGYADVTYCGLRLLKGMAYDPSLNTQTYLGGAAVVDAEYYALTQNAQYYAFALLPLTRPWTAGEVLIPWQGLAVPSGGGFGIESGYGYFAKNAIAPGDTLGLGDVEDITFYLGSPNYGQCVAFGFVYDLRFRRCIFHGGAQGAGSIPLGANYSLSFEECTCEFNSDAGFFLYYTIYTALNTRVQYYGQCVLKLVKTLGAWQTLFATDSPSCTYAIYTRGSIEKFAKFLFDFEGDVLTPSLGYLFVASGSDTNRCGVTLENFQPGSVPGSNTVPVIRMSGLGFSGGLFAGIGGSQMMLRLVDSVNDFEPGPVKALVAVDGPLCTVETQGALSDNYGGAGQSPKILNETYAAGSLRFGPPGNVPAGVAPVAIGGTYIAGLPGILGRYKANTLALGNGATVTTWAPLVGATTATLTAGSGNLTYVTNAVNGLAAVQWTSHGNPGFQMTGLHGTSNGGLTAFFVIKSASGALFSTASGGLGETTVYSDGNGASLAGSSPPVPGPLIGFAGAWYCLAVRVTAGAGHTMSAFVNGVKVWSYKIFPDNGVTWGGNPRFGLDNGGYGFIGLLADFVLFDGDLTDAQTLNVQYQLMNEYGLAI